MHAVGPMQAIASNEILRALNGKLDVNFNNVRLAGTDITHQLASLGQFLKPGEKDQGFTNISRMTGNIFVRNGIAQTNDLQALLDLGNIGVTGAANLITQALDLRVTAVLSKAASQQVGGTGIGGGHKKNPGHQPGRPGVPATFTPT